MFILKTTFEQEIIEKMQKCVDIDRVLSYNIFCPLNKTSGNVLYICAAMAQVAEHVLGKDEVTGSNPVSSSITKPARLYAVRVFHLIESIF